MKVAASLLVIFAVGAFDVFVLFLGWFSLAFFGVEMTTISLAMICVSVATAAAAYGLHALRKIGRGDFAI